MKVKSLRFRLIAWYFTAFFLSTIITFLVFYIVTAKIIFEQTDKEISLHAAKITDVIIKESSGIHGIFPKLKLNNEFAQIPGMLIVISDQTGNILTSSQSVNPVSQKLSELFQKSSNIIHPVYLNLNIPNSIMRAGIFPVKNENGVINLVLVAHPIEALQKSFQTLIVVLILVLIFVAIASIFGGYIIAKGALYPIAKFSESLKKIESDNLNQKITNPKTGDEIEELAATFNTLLERLRNSFEREQNFIENMAHELKTPLAVLKNTIEVTLSKKRSDLEYKKTMSETLIDINRLSVIFNDILDLAWIKADSRNTLMEKIDLSDLTLEVFELLQKMSLKKKIHASYEITKGIYISGHRQKLFRAFFNLIDNAVKYTPKTGNIALTLLKENNNIIWEISNTGPGINKQELLLVFNRFYRGKVNTNTFGFGLGLSICKTIIEMHGGRIAITCSPNKTTTVRIIFTV